MLSSKTFWKTVKPMFTDNIVLGENREVIKESYKIAEILNGGNAVKDLYIETMQIVDLVRNLLIQY